MLTWTHRPVLAKFHQSVTLSGPNWTASGSTPEYLDIWLGEGGDAMAIITRKPEGFELHAWWVSGKGQLTPTPRPVFQTLDEAVVAANDLVFARIDVWTRLAQDD